MSVPENKAIAPLPRKRDVIKRLAWIITPVALLLLFTYLLPPIHLNSPLALAAYWISESGGVRGMPYIGIAMVAFVVARPGLSWRQRGLELLAIVLGLGVVLGGAAYLNEHFVKPLFAVPRPNILELAESKVLPHSADDFYSTWPDKPKRSAYLKTILPDDDTLHPHIRNHWIEESGYSFPSGHSFSAMFFATFFLAMGLTRFTGRKLWIFYLLTIWAVAVCYSRALLRVHSPTDICIGGLEGILGGALAFLLVEATLQFSRPTPKTVP